MQATRREQGTHDPGPPVLRILGGNNRQSEGCDVWHVRRAWGEGGLTGKQEGAQECFVVAGDEREGTKALGGLPEELDFFLGRIQGH